MKRRRLTEGQGIAIVRDQEAGMCAASTGVERNVQQFKPKFVGLDASMQMAEGTGGREHEN